MVRHGRAGERDAGDRGAAAAPRQRVHLLEGTLAAAEANVAYADVVEALERIEAPIEYAWGVVGHLMGVKNSDELRAAHGEMQPKVVQTTTKLSQSAAVYAAVEHVLSSAGALDESQRRILQSSLQGMKLSGVALEGSAKEQFNANRMELAELSTKFSNNVLDATKAWSMVVTDASQVDGLPPSAKAPRVAAPPPTAPTARRRRRGRGNWGSTMPAYLAMKYIKDGAVREKLYRLFVTRAGAENEPLVRGSSSSRRSRRRSSATRPTPRSPSSGRWPSR